MVAMVASSNTPFLHPPALILVLIISNMEPKYTVLAFIKYQFYFRVSYLYEGGNNYSLPWRTCEGPVFRYSVRQQNQGTNN